MKRLFCTSASTSILINQNNTPSLSYRTFYYRFKQLGWHFNIASPPLQTLPQGKSSYICVYSLLHRHMFQVSLACIRAYIGTYGQKDKDLLRQKCRPSCKKVGTFIRSGPLFWEKTLPETFYFVWKHPSDGRFRIIILPAILDYFYHGRQT